MKPLVKRVLYPLPDSLDRLLHSVLLEADVPRWLDDRRAFPKLRSTPAELLTGVGGAAGHETTVLRVLYDAIANLSAPGLEPLDEHAAALRDLFRKRLTGFAAKGIKAADADGETVRTSSPDSVMEELTFPTN